MKMVDAIPESLLAPCGITCQACYAYLRKKNSCPGCRVESDAKPAYCQRCKIKDCVDQHGYDLCYQCDSFPCARIKQIDKRYRTRYQVHLIDNAVRQRTIGLAPYLIEEHEAWSCAECGGVVSMHSRACSECGRVIP